MDSASEIATLPTDSETAKRIRALEDFVGELTLLLDDACRRLDRRDRIDALVDGPAIEVFARSSKPGWAAWGNEVGKFDAVERVALSRPPAAAEAAHAGSATACVARVPGAVCNCSRCADLRLTILGRKRA